MISLLRQVDLLALTVLSACTDAQHPFDLYLSQLRPVTISPLAGVTWPVGTQLCPLTIYQNSLQLSAPEAKRVNVFLKQKKFLGDENHWSLVVIKADGARAGEDGIELFVFKLATTRSSTSRHRSINLRESCKRVLRCRCAYLRSGRVCWPRAPYSPIEL